jgi:hypothetical protein
MSGLTESLLIFEGRTMAFRTELCCAHDEVRRFQQPSPANLIRWFQYDPFMPPYGPHDTEVGGPDGEGVPLAAKPPSSIPDFDIIDRPPYCHHGSLGGRNDDSD